MAYYLVIDARPSGGTTGHVELPVMNFTGDFTITMDIEMITNGGTSGAAVILGVIADNADFFAIYGGGTGVFIQSDGGGFANFGDGNWIGAGVRSEVVFRRVGLDFEMQLNGGAWLPLSIDPYEDPVQPYSVSTLGQTGDNYYSQFRLYGLRFEAAGIDRFYDPSLSNGTGLVLTDSISGQHGTLVNYPAGDAYWVEYDGIPSNLSFTELSETSVRLTWDVTSVDLDYDLEWRILNDTGNETLVENLTVEQYDVTGLTAGVEYEFRVRETDGVTDSEWTAWSSFEIAEAIVPAMTDLVEVSVGETTAEFTVSVNTTGTLYYLVDTSPTADEASIEAGSSQTITTAGSQTINITGLTDNTSYYVHTFFEDGDLVASNILNSAQFTTDEVIVPAGAPTSSLIFSGVAQGSWNGSAFVGSEDLTVPAGTDHLLIFLTGAPTINPAFSFQLGGSAVTLDATVSDTNGNGAHVFSIPNPTTGTLTFSYNFTSSNPTLDIVVIGVSGTSGIRGSILTAGGYTFGTRTISVTTDVDDLVIDCFAGTSLATNFDPAAAQTLLSETANRGSSELVATGLSTDMTWTHPDSWTAIIAIPFIGAAAGGTLPTPINLSITDLTSESATLNWEQGV